MTRFSLLVLLAALISSIAAPAQSHIDCDALNSQILKSRVRYCIYLPASYDSGANQQPPKRYPVLYFLHGLGDSERTLFSDNLSRQRHMGEFLIVAPEGSRTFYINSFDGSVRYSDFFLQEFIPLVEGKYRVAKGRENRAISGFSMGGYGALRFAFAYPEMFSSVSAQSAALITDTPAQPAKVLGNVFGDPIDSRHWKENSPFALAGQNQTALRSVAIYFNCGRDDDFGFEKGADVLHHDLKKAGVPHQYHLYSGDHSLAYFLAHLDEVLAFHSQNFALK